MSKSRLFAYGAIFGLGYLVLSCQGFYDFGLPFGYYGKVNRILADIDECENLTVVQVWRHKDLTLEDFWIDVRDESGIVTKLDFSGGTSTPMEEHRRRLSKVECRKRS